MDGRIIRVYRRGKARVDYAAFANFDVDDLCQSIIDGQRRIYQAGEKITASRAHNGRANIRRTFGLVGAAGEVEEQVSAFLFHAHMQAHRRIQIDPIAVDEPLALADAVGPRGDFSAHLGFRPCNQLLKPAEDRFLAVALHHLLEAIFSEPRGAYLAAQVANHQLRSAAVGAENGFDVFTGLIFVNEFDWRDVQPFFIDLPG